MRKRDCLLSGCMFAMGLGISSGAMACSTSAWDAISGAVAAGSPTTTSRMEQLCGLAVTDTGYVQDNSPIDAEDTRIRLRFYVLVAGGAAATTEKTLLKAYQDDGGTSPAFTISYQPSGTDKLSFNPTGGTAVQFNAPNGWTMIEIDWQAGVGLRYWVNTSPNVTDDNPTGTTDAGTATKIGMVRLGAPDGLGELTRVTVDSFQANRTNSIGSLYVGDANGSGTLTSGDATRILNEVSLGGTLSNGVPDCNLSGTITAGDATCVLGKIAL